MIKISKIAMARYTQYSSTGTASAETQDSPRVVVLVCSVFICLADSRK
jgi:hypothetical protein